MLSQNNQNRFHERLEALTQTSSMTSWPLGSLLMSIWMTWKSILGLSGTSCSALWTHKHTSVVDQEYFLKRSIYRVSVFDLLRWARLLRCSCEVDHHQRAEDHAQVCAAHAHLTAERQRGQRLRCITTQWQRGVLLQETERDRNALDYKYFRSGHLGKD